MGILRSWFLENLPLKAFALFVAIALYLYVGERRDVSSTIGTRVKLVIQTSPNMMVGGELQWGQREMFRDPYKGEGLKLQFSFKYNFSHTLGGSQ